MSEPTIPDILKAKRATEERISAELDALRKATGMRPVGVHVVESEPQPKVEVDLILR